MTRKEYKIIIEAPATKVYDYMLGLSNKLTYETWTAAFNPTSTYDGNWDKGSKMLFLGTDDKGNTGGMVSRILENDMEKFVSIEHFGILENGNEIITGPQVEGWAGGQENYSFEEENGKTIVTVAVDIAENYSDYFNETYPNALKGLKELIEKG